jgi:hypothetical protein
MLITSTYTCISAVLMCDFVFVASVITLFSLLQNFQKVSVMIQPSEPASMSVPCKPTHSRLSSSGSVCRICHEGAKFIYYTLFTCKVNLFSLVFRLSTLWIILEFPPIRNTTYLGCMEFLSTSSTHATKSQINVLYVITKAALMPEFKSPGT